MKLAITLITDHTARCKGHTARCKGHTARCREGGYPVQGGGYPVQGGGYPPGIPYLHHPGYTPALLPYTAVPGTAHGETERGVKTAWAQEGEKTWVEASVRLKSPKSVKNGIPLRAGCFRLPGEKNGKIG